MDEAPPPAELVQRLRSGDARAAELLFVRYAQRLTRLAEQHLSRTLAGKIDGEDIVQSVFRTFFVRCGRGEFQIDSSAQLWRLLVKITLTKAQAKGRYHTAAQRNVGAEQPGGDAWLAEALTHEPSPSEAAALVDEIEALLRGFPPTYAQVLGMRLEGYAVPEIAQRVGVSRQTVYRILHLLQQRLAKSNPPS